MSTLRKQDIIPMLRREEELRFSSAVQSRFTIAENSSNSEWMDVANEVQLQVLFEFNYVQTSKSLNELRLAAQSHPEISVYIRENRARQGQLSVGDIAPNVQVKSINNTQKNILDYSNADRPLVIIAGSYS